MVAAATWAIRRVFASSATAEHETYQSPTQVWHRMVLLRGIARPLGWLQNASLKPPQTSTLAMWPQTGSLTAPLDGKAYEMALARTRQAVSVHQAMQFQRQGNPARSGTRTVAMLQTVQLIALLDLDWRFLR